jgi:Zn-finger protein
MIDLDMKKNFFYVINPDGQIIDCAKIYSFLHENNIYQRIMAKILKNVDERTAKSLN